ncbi:hypothetical protein C2845_PM13G06620 [Panicum miliaceum]|uniref:Disease resistance protein RGA3 n=1 Tax=Panicum miliaceum TaxID=4540 RepID=A0A3L6RNK6_PANMI|nr:hypothetical protein C2845_PM13G06620 [Panicum miliaceum]
MYKNNGPEVSLRIEGNGVSDSTFWKVLDFNNLIELKELDVCSCPPLPLDHFGMLSSLKTLVIRMGGNCWAVGESHARYQFPVESFYVYYHGGSGKELTRLLSCFPKLSKLRIEYCRKLTGLGVMEQNAAATPTTSPPSLDEKVVLAVAENGQQQQRCHGTETDEVELSTAAEGLAFLPPELHMLRIVNCPGLRLHPNSLHVTDNTAGEAGGGLQDFLWDCTVERFTEEQEKALQLLTSLQLLKFSACDMLQCLPAGLHMLPNLKILRIIRTSIRSLPKDGLPSSLQELWIDSCPAIRSLPKEALPSSLQDLIIRSCPAILQSLHKDGIPNSLRLLDVSDHELKDRMQFRRPAGCCSWRHSGYRTWFLVANVQNNRQSPEDADRCRSRCPADMPAAARAASSLLVRTVLMTGTQLMQQHSSACHLLGPWRYLSCLRGLNPVSEIMVHEGIGSTPN